MNLLRTSLVVWMTVVMLGISALSVYLACFTRPIRNTTTYAGWILHYAGYVIIGAALFVMFGLMIAGMVHLGLELYR